MHREDELAGGCGVVGERPEQGREVGRVHVVHALDWVVKDERTGAGARREVQRDEET